MKLLRTNRKTALVAGVALIGATLAGCDTTTLVTQVASVEQQVQSDTQLACGFIPTVATIAALIPGVGIAVADAATIASAICTAIKNAPVPSASARMRSLRMGGAAGPAVAFGPVTLPNGQQITISGQFVR